MEDNIDLSIIIKKILINKKKLFLNITVSLIVSILFLTSTEKLYTSKTTIIPQLSGGASENSYIRDIASDFGFDLPTGSSRNKEINPNLYQKY